jgi:pimeloyl-ACP methyl ester carboxylesterase
MTTTNLPPMLVHFPLTRAGVLVLGDLVVPPGATRIVVFAHGGGSSRQSPRNQEVAQRLQQAGYATLLLDLLSREEMESPRCVERLRFNVPGLVERLVEIVDNLGGRPDTRDLPVVLFGASTGAAAALVTTFARPRRVVSVISRGGRVDLAAHVNARIQVPVLLIVGENDPAVLSLNRTELARLPRGELLVVPGAGHLFEEPGALDAVAEATVRWAGAEVGTPA